MSHITTNKHFFGHHFSSDYTYYGTECIIRSSSGSNLLWYRYQNSIYNYSGDANRCFEGCSIKEYQLLSPYLWSTMFTFQLPK